MWKKPRSNKHPIRSLTRDQARQIIAGGGGVPRVVGPCDRPKVTGPCEIRRIGVVGPCGLPRLR